MRTRISSTLLPAVLALLASLMLASAAIAAPTTLTATLAGGGEGDEDGSGSATITLDPETGEVCWDLSVENIADVTASHIHVGAEGESGDVVVPLDVDGFSGTSDECADAGEADLDAILANPAGFYVNIHTEDFPAGAIRGQLAAESPDTAMTAPGSSPLAPAGLALLFVAGALFLRTAARRAR